MIKKYIDKYLDRVVDEGAKTLKQVRLTLLLIGIGVVVFFVGILSLIGYLITKLV
ncbi:MAG: hypothetical protein WDZ40_01665 [Candidatus Spechtbacterales bacterium]